MGEAAALSPLSPAFTTQVQYWAPLINAWSILYQMDPNLIATVIQIESCGDPTVGSSAGAQGLFQVMPFHFTPGEDMLDVQTNAARGLSYLAEGLAKANGHVGLALAGYNGGHGVIDRGGRRGPQKHSVTTTGEHASTLKRPPGQVPAQHSRNGSMQAAAASVLARRVLKTSSHNSRPDSSLVKRG